MHHHKTRAPAADSLLPIHRGWAEVSLLPALASTFAADAVCLYEIDARLNAGEHRLIGPCLHDRRTIAAAGWLAALQPEPGVPPAFA